MSVLRKTLLALFGITTIALFVYGVVLGNQGGGGGEVGVILQGAITIAAFLLAGLTAVVCLTVFLWDRKGYRNLLLLVLACVVLVPPSYLAYRHISDKIRLAAHQREQNNRDERIRAIADIHIEKMATFSDPKRLVIYQRKKFNDDLEAAGLFPHYQGAEREFYWFHNLYVWIFIDEEFVPAELSHIVDFPNEEGCKIFVAEYGSLDLSKGQRRIFKEACPTTTLP